MDHLDELRVATASSLPLNGLAPRTYARDHATFEALSNQPGLIADWLVDRIADWLVDRLSSSRTAPLSVFDCGLRRRCDRRRPDARGHGHIADSVGAANAES
jgi:hypothetical protein